MWENAIYYLIQATCMPCGVLCPIDLLPFLGFQFQLSAVLHFLLL
jgi:hypothetical protein